MVKATILLIFGVLTCMICIAVSVVKLNACGALMEKKGLKGDIWATRILVQNGRYFIGICGDLVHSF